MRCAVLVIVSLLITSAAHGRDQLPFTAIEQQWIRDHPVVRYAIDPYWPMEYVDKGEHKGLTRDYIDQIARISGLQFRRVQTNSWTNTLDLIAQGHIDLSTAVTKNLLDPSDHNQLLLTDIYFVGATVVVTRSGEPVLFSPHKLNDKVVAVKGGGAYERYLRRHFPGIQLLLITDPEAALAALADGRVDAVVGLDVVLQPIITRRFLGTAHLAGVLADMPVISVMGVSTASPELVSIINKSLASMTSELTDTMVDRWIAKTDYGAPSWGAILRYYSLELSLFTFCLVTIALLAGLARRAQKAAQQSEADKSAFLAMMSHEIRTPMNGVLSSIELLQSTQLTQPQHELATLANMSACNLLEMLDDVLDISKLEAKGISLEHIPTDIYPLAQGLADIHRLGASRHNTSLIFNVVGLDGVLLIIDPVRIRQIISNLLSNAVKFTDGGEVALDLSFQITAPDTGRLKIVVSDTGIGIDKTQQGRLFKAFVQADNSITRRYGGSGLGLSICKQLVEMMGGRIALYSQPGQGTQVTCTLTVGFQNKIEDTLPYPPALQSAKTPAVTHQQVLVVEDHPINRITIELQLRELGYRALIVEDGMAALAAMEQREDIAIVLLDCHLPDMDGYEVARRIRQKEQEQVLAHIPIIAISASTDEAHQLKCIESGIDGNLPKPLGLSDLKQLFGLWLSAPDTQQAPITPLTAAPPSLRKLFIETSHEDIACLRKAFEAQDLVRSLHYAHRLHGSALAAQTDELAELAMELEGALREPAVLNNDWGRRLDAIEKALGSLSDDTVPDKS